MTPEEIDAVMADWGEKLTAARSVVKRVNELADFELMLLTVPPMGEPQFEKFDSAELMAEKLAVLRGTDFKAYPLYGKRLLISKGPTWMLHVGDKSIPIIAQPNLAVEPDLSGSMAELTSVTFANAVAEAITTIPEQPAPTIEPSAPSAPPVAAPAPFSETQA